MVNDYTLALSQPLASKVGEIVYSEETLSNKQDGGSEANAGVDDVSSAHRAPDPSSVGVQADASKDISAVSASKSTQSEFIPCSTLFLPPKAQGAVTEEPHATNLSTADGDGKSAPSSSSIQDLGKIP